MPRPPSKRAPSPGRCRAPQSQRPPVSHLARLRQKAGTSARAGAASASATKAVVRARLGIGASFRVHQLVNVGKRERRQKREKARFVTRYDPVAKAKPIAMSTR